MRISAPKEWAVVVNKNIFFGSNQNTFWDPRHLVLKFDNLQNMTCSAQFFYACRISAMRISASKGLTVEVNKNIFLQYQTKHLFGPETCGAEMQQPFKTLT
jgi:hypothetical protein